VLLDDQLRWLATLPALSYQVCFRPKAAVQANDCCLSAADPKRTLAKQSVGEFSSAVSTTRKDDVAFQTDAEFAEIRRCPIINFQPLQSGAPPFEKRSFKAQPHRRSC
jgi:hypothetical protein